ncbi:hypothetical protein D623_10021750 [Myotis brandtii]|uniref:Uncharacterized protein n=1 Tax=Myotis brandtii TaxID=109478 RepID=S7N8A2_MYOBR|nr:hypothetical protein D623_10021750 [Myotis brandtii]
MAWPAWQPLHHIHTEPMSAASCLVAEVWAGWHCSQGSQNMAGALTGMAANGPIQLCFSENRYNTVEFKSRRTVWTLSTKVVASPVATGTDRLSFGSSQEFPT